MTLSKCKAKVSSNNLYSSFIPLQSAKNIKVPVVLIHATGDSLVNPRHSKEIFKATPDKLIKRMLEVQGEHNDSRDIKDVTKVYLCIKNTD